MITDRRARWTANGALFAALVAVGLSTWAVGCREQSSSEERSLGASTPAAAAAAKTVTVTASPAAAPPAAAPAVTPISVTKPPEAKREPVVSAKDTLAVRRVVVTHAIEDREPASVSSLELGDRPILAFVELANRSDEEQRVIVTFERAGSSVGHVTLKVPAESSRWRTWAQTRRIRERGEWQAVVRSEDGEELSRASFTVK